MTIVYPCSSPTLTSFFIYKHRMDRHFHHHVTCWCSLFISPSVVSKNVQSDHFALQDAHMQWPCEVIGTGISYVYCYICLGLHVKIIFSYRWDPDVPYPFLPITGSTLRQHIRLEHTLKETKRRSRIESLDASIALLSPPTEGYLTLLRLNIDDPYLSIPLIIKYYNPGLLVYYSVHGYLASVQQYKMGC